MRTASISAPAVIRSSAEGWPSVPAQTMRISFPSAAAAFAAYTSAYGTDNPRITLKVEHTLRTAGFAEETSLARLMS